MLVIILFIGILFIVLHQQRRKLRKLIRVRDLVLLRVGLDALKQFGRIEAAAGGALQRDAEKALMHAVYQTENRPVMEQVAARRWVAWRFMTAYLGRPMDDPPWVGSETPPVEETRAASRPEPPAPPAASRPAIRERAAALETASLSTFIRPPKIKAKMKVALAAAGRSLVTPKAVAAAASVSADTLANAQPRPAATPSAKPVPPSRSERKSSKRADMADFALTPKKPSVLETALGKAAGWSRWLAPFLVQNIGWFFSGFFFVTGSIFLVTCTTGLARSLVVCLSLATYTLLILAGAYQLRKRRPELGTAARVLAVLGTLLVPLAVAASVRLADVHMALGIGISVVSLPLFGWAVQLASGLVDRSLTGCHAYIFMGLTAFHLLAPLMARTSAWPVLASVHLLILAVLGHALVRFVRRGLPALILDREVSAWYGVGTLIHAAATAGLHLTWRFSGSLPPGYFGPAVMLLAGFLFYADARIKRLERSFAWLSRFTMGIYAVSALGLLLSVSGPGFRIAALAMGAAIYGAVIWRYLTLTPLWMMLGCLFGLYGLVVLAPLPTTLHFFAALPGLAGLWVMQRGFMKRGARALARALFRVRVVAGVLLGLWSIGWSFWHGAGGFAAWVAGMALTAGLYGELRWTPRRLFGASDGNAAAGDLRDTPWFYSVPAFVCLTLAASPFGVAAGGGFPLAGALLIAALVWLIAGLRGVSRSSSMHRATVMLNSAVVAAIVAVGITAVRLHGAFPWWPSIPVFAGAGGLFLGLGIVLRDRLPIYPGLALLGVSGALAKQTWFPGPSTGLGEMALFMAMWETLRRIERIHRLRNSWVPDGLPNRPEIILMGVHASVARPLVHVLGQPMRIAMSVLWLAGTVRLGTYLGVAGWSPAWSLSAAVGAAALFLMLARERQPEWFPVALTMGLAPVLTPAFFGWGFRPQLLSALTAGYAILLWWTAEMLAARPWVARVQEWLLPDAMRPVDHFKGIRSAVHDTASGLIHGAVLVALAFWMMRPEWTPLPVFVMAMLFFHLAGNGERYTHNVVALLGAAGLVVHASLLGIAEPVRLLADTRTGIAAAGFGLLLWGAHRVWGRMASGRYAGQAVRYRRSVLMAALVSGGAAGFQQLLLSLNGFGPVVPAGALLAGGCLLAAGRDARFRWRYLPGVAAISHGLICGWLAVVHPEAAFRFRPIHGDTWIFIAGLAAALGAAAIRGPFPEDFRRSLHLTGTICWAWAMARALPLMGGILAGGVPDATILFFLAVAGMALFVIATPFHWAGGIRGLGMVVIGGVGFMGAWAMIGVPPAVSGTVWAFLLWAVRPAMVRFNRRHPKWAVHPGVWLWAGSIWVTAYAPLSQGPAVFGDALYWLVAAAWFFSAMRDWKHRLLDWTAATALTGAGVLSAFHLAASNASPLPLVAGVLGWANLLLMAGSGRYETLANVLKRAGWQVPRLGRPLRFWSGAIVWCHLIALVGLLGVFIAVWSDGKAFELMTWLAAMTTLSVLHLHYRIRWRVTAHAAVLAVVALSVLFWAAAVDPPSWPVFMVLCSGALLMADRLGGRWAGADGWRRSILKAVHGWARVCPWLSLAGLIVLPNASFGAAVVALALLAGVMGGAGWPRHDSAASRVGRLLGVVLLHVWPVAFLPARTGPAIALWRIGPLLASQFERFQSLLPWTALELALAAWIVVGLIRLRNRWPALNRVRLRDKGIAVLAGMELALHMLLTMYRATAGHMPPESWLPAMAATVAAGLLAGWLIRKFRVSHKPMWIYLIGALAGLSALYVRVWAMGIVPVTAGESMVLMVVAWGMSLWGDAAEHPALSRPLIRLSMAVWAPALLTAPWHWGSSHATAVLLSGGAFWLFHHHVTRRKNFLYTGAALLNAALYLWIPAWSDATRLFQLYLVPVASTVLVVLQLHRKELRPGVLNGCRLTALCLVYAGASLDLFLRPALSVFAVALASGLAGVAGGILLRIRAFLYGGAVFVVVNVLGQLVRFYPQHSLGKGVVLVATGAAILSAMIGFSAQRETILKRIRIIRADLAAWE